MGIFDDDNYNTDRYGEADGVGCEAEWKNAYNERMGSDEYEQVLDDSTAYAGGRRGKALVILKMDITIVTLTEKIIKVAYRKLVMVVHPDHGGTVEAFKEVHAAYSLLMDELGD